jgi:hypothetical protein
MGTINCELNSIIEIDIGISGLLLSQPDRAQNGVKLSLKF